MFQDNKIQLTKKYLPPIFIVLLMIVYAVWNKPHKNYSNTKYQLVLVLLSIIIYSTLYKVLKLNLKK